MPLLPTARRAIGLLCLPALVVGLGACGSAVSTSGFKGTQHEVAQAISNLQSDATSGDQKKICANDLAGAVVTRLGGAKACEKAIKDQLAEIDSLTVSVQSIQLGAAGTTASARVKSTFAGKTRPSTVALVKEAGKWKISALQ
jgi:hypothetical protein